MSKETVLLADVGGTNVRFAIYTEGQQTEVEFDAKYPCEKFKSFEEAAKYYLSQKETKPTLCVVGAAGNIDEARGEVLTTNTPWKVSIPKLKAKCHYLKHARLVNDFALQGWALAELKPTQYRSLFNQPKVTNLLKSKVVIAGLGTGWGTCLSLTDGNKPSIIYTSESGHSSLPHIDFENDKDNQHRDRILEVLKAHYRSKNGFVIEHIGSGTGISNVYHALRDGYIPNKALEDSGWVKSEEIEHLAQNGDPIALKTFDIVSGYAGAHLGSLAATTKADVIFLCGGLFASEWVAKHFEESPHFKKQFTQRAGMTDAMKQVRFVVSLYRDMATLGAVVRAKSLIDMTKQEEQTRKANKKMLHKLLSLQAFIEDNCPKAISAMHEVVKAVNQYKETTLPNEKSRKGGKGPRE